jgi:nucleotide-binding universal stress UspA family protein
VITQYLEGMKRRLEEARISADEDVQKGQGPTVILACAAAVRCGIIALSTRGRSATGPNLLGITTDMLMRSSSVPIVVRFRDRHYSLRTQ